MVCRLLCPVRFGGCLWTCVVCICAALGAARPRARWARARALMMRGGCGATGLACRYLRQGEDVRARAR
jgi:hypothetical protein